MRQKRPRCECVQDARNETEKDLVRVVKPPDVKDENGQVLAPGGVSLDITGRKPEGARTCAETPLV